MPICVGCKPNFLESEPGEGTTHYIFCILDAIMKPPDQHNPYDLIQELSLLEPKGLRLFNDNFGDLCLECLEKDGEILYSKVKVLRAFPLTHSEQFIIFRDQKDAEIGVLMQPSQLDENSRQLLQAHLEKIYFMPKITKIYNIDSEFGAAKWEVQTNHGRRSFDLASRYDIRILGHRVLIKDLDGNRYEISNYRILDKKSIALLEQQM